MSIATVGALAGIGVAVVAGGGVVAGAGIGVAVVACGGVALGAGVGAVVADWPDAGRLWQQNSQLFETIARATIQILILSVINRHNHLQ